MIDLSGFPEWLVYGRARGWSPSGLPYTEAMSVNQEHPSCNL